MLLGESGRWAERRELSRDGGAGADKLGLDGHACRIPASWLCTSRFHVVSCGSGASGDALIDSRRLCLHRCRVDCAQVWRAHVTLLAQPALF